MREFDLVLLAFYGLATIGWIIVAFRLAVVVGGRDKFLAFMAVLACALAMKSALDPIFEMLNA